MKEHLPHIPRLLAVALGLLAAMTLLTGGTVGVARTRSPGYACLRFNEYDIVDLYTGFTMLDRRPRARPSYQPPGPISPDGRYQADLHWGPDGSVALTLTPRAEGSAPITVEERIQGLEKAEWSSRNRLVYAWGSQETGYFIGVASVDADGVLQKTILPVNNPAFLYFWSPDGAYLLYSLVGEQALHEWAVADGSDRAIPLYGLIEPRTILWSPDGAQLAYLQSDLRNSWLTIVRPGIDDYSFDLHAMSADLRLVWSPDSRYLALQYIRQRPSWRLDVFSADQDGHRHIAEVTPRGNPFLWPRVVWSADGRMLVLVRGQQRATQETRWDLLAYPIDQPGYRIVISNLTKEPLAMPGNERRLAVTYRESISGKQNVVLLDIDGANRVPLVTNADDAGAPYWSPDGRYVAVAWATGQGQQRVVRLTVAHQDGTGLVTLDNGFWDVRDLRWLRDGKSLAFVAWRGDAQGRPSFSAEVADLEAGHLRRLAEKLAQISMFHQDLVTGGIMFWWRAMNGEVGVDAYTPDGTRLFRFRADPEAAVTIDGEISAGDIWVARSPGAPNLFIAPGGGIAALKLGPLGHESLHLAPADGDWVRLVRSGLSGLGDPLWAPDGTLVAFTQSVNAEQVTLEVVSADGDEVRRFDAFQGMYYNLSWSRCD